MCIRDSYLDGGFANAKEFILKFVLNDLEHKKLFYDSKTILQAVSYTHLDVYKRQELISRAVRGHWSIESMHWHLDVTFREDADTTICLLYTSIRYYKKLLSVETDDYAVYAHSPFKEANRLFVLGQDVSTKYTRRGYEMYELFAIYIKNVDRKSVV